MRKNVDVLLMGSYSTGYAVSVHPWRVRVSKHGQDYITWSCNRPVKIDFSSGGHFKGYTQNPNKPIKAKTGKVNANAPGGLHHYSIEIECEQNHTVAIDPDYRIDP